IDASPGASTTYLPKVRFERSARRKTSFILLSSRSTMCCPWSGGGPHVPTAKKLGSRYAPSPHRSRDLADNGAVVAHRSAPGKGPPLLFVWRHRPLCGPAEAVRAMRRELPVRRTRHAVPRSPDVVFGRQLRLRQSATERRTE